MLREGFVVCWYLYLTGHYTTQDGATSGLSRDQLMKGWTTRLTASFFFALAFLKRGTVFDDPNREAS